MYVLLSNLCEFVIFCLIYVLHYALFTTGISISTAFCINKVKRKVAEATIWRGTQGWDEAKPGST